MKLERAHEYVSVTVAIAIGCALAYYFGKLAGQGQFGLIGAALGLVAFIALLMSLREQIWLLIPVSIQLNGMVEVLPGRPAIRDLSILFVFGGIIALQAFKVIRRKPKYETLDFWVLVNLLYLITVYVRNPAGGDALGTDIVGGRPYLNIIVAGLAYWSLSRVTLPTKLVKGVFYSIVALSTFSGVAIMTQIHLPSTKPFLSQLFGDPGDTNPDSISLDPDMVDRKFYMGDMARPLVQALIAIFPPVTLLNPFHIGRFFLLMLGFVGILLSGYRSSVLQMAAYFLIGALVRGAFLSALRPMIVGAIGLMMIVLMQGTLFQLPMAVQRSMSFLPGDWNSTAASDADYSSQWRFEMWERMLTTDLYIRNKTLGDGFGMTKQQLMQNEAALASRDANQQQETFMITGLVHSGPVTSIRYVGYVGLCLIICLLFTLGRDAWRICKQARGTPYFHFTLYLSIPVIYLPIGFIFVYGSYDTDVPNCLLYAGLLKMLRTSLELYKSELEQSPSAPQRPVQTFGQLTTGRPVPVHMNV